MSLFAGLRRLFFGRRNDADLRDELAFHIEAETQKNLAAGMPANEARRQALIAFGGVQQTRESVREIRWGRLPSILVQDLRFGWRMLRHVPGFTFVAVITLALGIGANTAVFSLADTLLLHPLPFPHLDRLVTVFVRYGNSSMRRRMSPADFRDYQQRTRAFENLSAYSSADFNISGGSVPERVSGAKVSANFFSTIRLSAITGRTFSQDEELPGRANVAVLSYGLWMRRFGADTQVIGTDIKLNGLPYTIIGVMDKKLMFPGGAELWVPVEWTGKEAADRSNPQLEVFGRLKPGVTLEQAQQEMKAEAQALAARYPATNKDVSVQLRPLRLVVNGTLMLPMTELLFISALLVLLLACANVANLQLSRSTVRTREMAVRAALGARRGRLIGQLLAENLLLGTLGAVAAFVMARWILAYQAASVPPVMLRLVAGLSEMRVDHRALLFMLIAALFSVLASGLVPALRASRADVAHGLKEGKQSSAGRARHRLRSGLVAVQIAIALALMGGTILTLRGFQNMASASRSFAPEHVLTFAVTLPVSQYPDQQRKAGFYQQALDKLGAMPGAQSAAVLTTTPLSNNGVVWTRFRTDRQQELKADDLPGGIIQSISADYFDVMHIPLLRGRRFGRTDASDVPVAIVNERLAGRFFPGSNPIGKRLKIEDSSLGSRWMEIVGVAGDVRYDWTDEAPEFTIYRPFTQAPIANTFFAVRTTADPLSLAPAVRKSMSQLDAELPVYEVETLQQAINDEIAGLKGTGDFVAGFGLLALILAGVGVYGVMACSVAERRQEVGIRMALGADRTRVMRLVLRRGLLLTLIGIIAGVPLAVALARSLGSIYVLYGVKAAESTLLLSCAAILTLISFLACAVPARRATQVEPMVALRSE
jgi:putative ABC transport system permease protein